VIPFVLSVKENITGITGNSINTVRKIKPVKENLQGYVTLRRHCKTINN